MRQCPKCGKHTLKHYHTTKSVVCVTRYFKCSRCGAHSKSIEMQPVLVVHRLKSVKSG